MGPGLTRVEVQEDPLKLNVAKDKINKMLAQIPDNWDPQKRAEYIKVVIRSVLSGLVACSRKGLKLEIEQLVENLNDKHNLKVKACSLDDEVKKTRCCHK
jgi:hypothetical protein